ncbi:MAG: hypothetical protein IKK21_11405 [Clostridia bacterium]|nr:hypothetical protein [Clostridia bacterium]
MKYLRRLIWYAASRLLLITLVLGIMVVSFYYAMNATNIYIVLKDGMARRAQVVMMEEDPAELTKYFQQSFLERDSVLIAHHQGQSPYKDYNVRGIDHRLSMEFTWVWPWDETARVVITERIPRIDGRAKGSTAEALVAAGGNEALYPPRWQSARYRAILARENGQWHVKSLTLLETLSD